MAAAGARCLERQMGRLAILLALAAPAWCGEPVRTLIFSGRNNHEWRVTTPLIREILTATARFDVRVLEEPAGFSERTLAGYELLVLDYNGVRWGETAEAAVEQFVRSGKGLVAIHAAAYAFAGLEVLGDRHARTGIFEPPWPAYGEIVGGQFSHQEPRTGHGKRHIFTVKFADRDHPVSRGLPETFLANDELYHHMRMKPHARILATAYDDPKMGGTGKAEPILWTVQYGKGRVFHTTLGHDAAAMAGAGFRQTLTRGSEWAARGDVAPETATQARAPVRVMLVVGGHDHDPSLYPILDGRRDIQTTVAPHPKAFEGEMRKRYDVLLMYDMLGGLSEKRRQNLRNFTEAGKGIVVLHHALASNGDWPWWYEEVVGGRYIPSTSTYKHDVELRVEPAANHPVLRGVPPLHLFDETYKGMWISPGNTVLLKTDHPTSDGPVAWISPFEKSRVVVIQLGHDRHAHEHPGFRQLLQNAVLWAGRR
jgi:type 1 glutamine amidotransferase